MIFTNIGKLAAVIGINQGYIELGAKFLMSKNQLFAGCIPEGTVVISGVGGSKTITISLAPPIGLFLLTSKVERSYAFAEYITKN